ncbi:MAG: nucleotidyltransferase domain-containing protein [Clostridia bacterium]|nr:nucleotidyltransferase domain-containing protein [Clostridia bacterium]
MKFGLSNEIYTQIKNITKKYNKYEFKIFGSRSRGDFKNNSDIDIAVIGEVSKEDEFAILNEFDLLEIPYTIDVVFFNKIQKIEFLNSIKAEGVTF